ncbi:MAG: bifunctional riboflavin kinase/FAD synthetase [Lachnospiraceae bacterium]|nr:bifunctional riboflavin kinase/FAD synthetase [Lachnospiraceae bacterium]
MQYIVDTKEFQIMEPTVVSIGKFDGLHLGHQKLVKEMLRFRTHGRKAAIFTFSTPPGTLVKGKLQTMIMTNRERALILEQAGIDYLVEYPFDESVLKMEPERFLSEILIGRMGADIIVTGPDCHFGYKAAGDRALLEALAPKYGYRFIVVDKARDPQNKIISSTYIRDMLAEGRIEKANQLLGYHYYVSGVVEHGRSIGHRRLYPTANLVPPRVKHLPKYGVYVTRVTVEGKTYGGLTNVGEKPTIEGKNPAGVETYLYDFQGDLYGKTIKVELLDFVRPEMKFSSIEELKAQLDYDVKMCREMYDQFLKTVL